MHRRVEHQHCLALNEIYRIIRVVSIKMPDKQSRLKSLTVRLSRTKRPGNDFYRYVNQSWTKMTHIPQYSTNYGASEEIDKKNNEKILKLVNQLGSSKPSAEEVPKNPRDHLRFFSYIWNNTTAEKEEEYMKLLFHDLISSSEPDNVVRFLGWLMRADIPTVINISVDTETHSPFFLRTELSLGSLSLPLKYYSRKFKKSSVWLAYVKYVETCSIELGLPYLYYAIEAETELAEIVNMDTDTNSRPYTGNELFHLVPEFSWTPFMESLNIKSLKAHKWIISDPICIKRIFKWITKCLTSRPEYVAALFTLHLLNISGDHLRPSIKTARFNLFKKELYGISESPNKDLRYIAALSDTYPDILCNEFSDADYDSSKLKDVYSMIDKIKEAAIDVINESTMISKHTKHLTIEKIHRMKVEIGSNHSKYVPDAPYYPDSLIHTILSVKETRNKFILSQAGHRPNKDNIIYPCFIVNASYYEDYNLMMIPWGILHEPFYSNNKSTPLGWNYGGIGATLGHELCHAFDIEGINYNPRAIYRKWWTRKERTNFRAKTRKVKKFFNKFQHFGHHLDGELTLSENWADFGGLIVSLRALKKEADSMKLSEEDKEEAIRTLFISYASSWKDCIRRKKLIQQMKKSVHSLPEDRVNRIVPHFQEWVDVFDIKKSDALFIPPRERLKFL